MYTWPESIPISAYTCAYLMIWLGSLGCDSAQRISVTDGCGVAVNWKVDWLLDDRGWNLWWPVVGWPSAEATGKIRLCVSYLPGSLLGILHRVITVPRSVREQALMCESFSSLCLLHGWDYKSLTNPSQSLNSALSWPDTLLPES